MEGASQKSGLSISVPITDKYGDINTGSNLSMSLYSEIWQSNQARSPAGSRIIVSFFRIKKLTMDLYVTERMRLVSVLVMQVHFCNLNLEGNALLANIQLASSNRPREKF